MNKNDLLDLINDDDLGLLDIEKKQVSTTPDDRLVEKFVEINDFFEIHGLEPRSGGDIQEHKLASSLKHLRGDKEKRDFLKKYDKHNLLVMETKDFETVSDIFADDDFDLLAIEDDSILKIKNVPRVDKDRSDPDFVAKRETCLDFEKYKYLFDQCQRDLRNGNRKLGTFIESEMKEGDFFVLSGVLIYLDKIYDPYRGNSEKINRRTRCIYENGTESNALLRSLGKRLSEVGFAVKDTNESANTTNDDDKETGYIYILRSLSSDPEIFNIKNLFKIGFSATTVEKRIQNAEQDPTYLMAPVKIVATFKCFNMNPQKLERLLHRFFNESCLNIDITDKSGNRYTPKEWFIAPINTIEQVIVLIINGEIVNYSYDKESGLIIKNK